jgi:hypothetical protein
VDTMEQAWNRGIAKRGWLPSVLPRLPTPAPWWGNEPLEMGVEMGLAFDVFRTSGPRVQLPIPGEDREGN